MLDRVEKIITSNNGDVRTFILLPKQNSIGYVGKAKYAEEDFKLMFKTMKGGK